MAAGELPRELAGSNGEALGYFGAGEIAVVEKNPANALSQTMAEGS
jgi:hypothetical protein